MKLLKASEEQKVERDRATYAEWGQKLTLHQWLAREARLRAHAWSRVSMQTWLLVDETGAVLSSCETFKMKSLAKGSPGHTYGIASVFTEEHLRGKGYGRRVVKEAAAAVTAADPETQSVILFSEVGEAIYAAAEFVAVPSFERHFVTTARKSSATNLKAVSANELLALWPQLAPPRSEFAVWPSVSQLDWHFERERIYGELLRQQPSDVSAAGLAFGDALLAWVVDYKEDTLQAVYFQARSALEAQALLVKACEVAAERGLGKLVVWESESFSGWERLGIHGERVARDGSLAMIRPVAKGLEPSAWTPVTRSVWI